MKNTQRKNYNLIMRYIFGIILLFGGMSDFSAKPLFSVCAVLLGVSLLPILYELTPLKKVKYLYIILPVCLFVPTAILFAINR